VFARVCVQLRPDALAGCVATVARAMRHIGTTVAAACATASADGASLQQRLKCVRALFCVLCHRRRVPRPPALLRRRVPI
jgi:hypothetical protein